MPMHSLSTRLLATLRLLPVVLVVVLSAPAWITWPYLPSERQDFVLRMVKELILWTHGPSDSRPTEGPS